MGIGLLLLGIGCVIMSVADRLANAGGSVGPHWLVFVYLFFTLGEICMSPIGLSLVNKLAPEKMASLMMAVWFLCTAIANYLAGTLEEELKVYHINSVFLVATSILPGLLLLAATVPLKRWATVGSDPKLPRIRYKGHLPCVFFLTLMMLAAYTALRSPRAEP